MAVSIDWGSLKAAWSSFKGVGVDERQIQS